LVINEKLDSTRKSLPYVEDVRDHVIERGYIPRVVLQSNDKSATSDVVGKSDYDAKKCGMFFSFFFLFFRHQENNDKAAIKRLYLALPFGIAIASSKCRPIFLVVQDFLSGAYLQHYSDTDRNK